MARDPFEESGPFGGGPIPKVGQHPKISFEDYEAAYRRFLACLDESGITYSERGMDRLQIFQYFTASVPGIDGSTADDCYFKEFFDADFRWQVHAREPLSAEKFAHVVIGLKRWGADVSDELQQSGNTDAAIYLGRWLFGEAFADEVLNSGPFKPE